MEVNADKIPLLQSIPGNHVSKILIINKNEYIDNVWARTANISESIIIFLYLFYSNIYLFLLPICERYSLLTAKV